MIDLSDFKSAYAPLHFFEEISAIPHGSANTEKIADYLVNFAKSRDLYCYRDSSNNVLIRKAATKGYENRPAVIIQGHTDMVIDMTEKCPHDIAKHGVQLYRDGDFLRAYGSTLGGDDGVAVAYALAILDSEDIPHPEIEALFTSDEEIGLLGAAAFDTSLLQARTLINIDSDEEGIFTVGCAGGVRADVSLSLGKEHVTGTLYTLKVGGLIGGHSGVEIDRGRANAIKVGADILHGIKGLALVSLNGGSMDNAIPREFIAKFLSEENPEAIILERAERIKEKFKETDPDIDVKIESENGGALALSKMDSEKVISLLEDIPTGIVAMSADIEGLVETSLNIGILSLEEGEVKIAISFRSSRTQKKQQLLDSVKALAKCYGCSFSTRGDYPGWEYKKDSHLRDTACKVYRDLYGSEAKVVTIHAGLECGIFSDKIEGLDCISLGPDNFDIHTAEERLSLPSFARVWEFLKKLLKEI